jgi:hypothetical protein
MFKIRASAGGNIMSGLLGLTETQKIDLDTLLKQDKRTDKQTDKMRVLINKRDNIELPSGAKTYCKDWLKSQVYNRKKEIQNKYTEKGHIVEDNSIDFIADQLGYGLLIKNEFRKENDFMTGECDVVQPDHIIDVKNSWSWETFPLFETEIPNMDYYCQGQIYMHLWDKSKYKLIYILSDTPMYLIEKDAYYWCKNNGYEELESSILDKFIQKMTYPDIENKFKIKVFEFERDEKYIEDIITRVKLCREYIEELKTNLKIKTI